MADTNVDYQNQLDRANKLNDQLNQMFEANKAKYTTAEEQTANLNKQSQAAYQEQKIANQEAQNQFAQNQSANQLSALDAIRRSNASAIANGANAGLSAANQLSSILGLQEETSEEATNIANQAIENAAAYNTQLNENAVKGQTAANELNATLDNNATELAKSLATNADTIAKMISEERTRQSEEEQARTQAEQAKAQLEADERQAKIKNYTDILAAFDTDKYDENTRKYSQALQSEIAQAINNNDEKALELALEHMNTFTGTYNNLTDDIDQTIDIIKAEMQKYPDNSETKKFYQRALNNLENQKIERAKAQQSSSDDDGCVIEGSLITMADGTQRPVEEINKGDMLLAWDMFTGKFVSAPVSISEHNEAKEYSITKLIFSDKTQIDLTYEHGFYDVDLAKYVYLNDANAKDYIGHRFLKQKNKKHKKIKLVDVISYTKVISTHSPCTVRHLCFYVNNILTMPADTEIFTNVFKINKRKFIYNKKDMLDKVHSIGTFAPDYLAEYISSEIFYAFQCEFLKIKIEEGKTTIDEIKKLISKYAQYLK